jgi:hypothetical protein
MKNYYVNQNLKIRRLRTVALEVFKIINRECISSRFNYNEKIHLILLGTTLKQYLG